jgi:DNA-binding response OmpR family regulator
MSTFKARAVKKAQVLIVDDKPSIVDFIATTLSANDYAVEAHSNPLRP